MISPCCETSIGQDKRAYLEDHIVLIQKLPILWALIGIVLGRLINRAPTRYVLMQDNII